MTYGIELREESVCLYEERSRHEGGGLVVGHEAFLAGDYPSWIDTIGHETIAEAQRAVRELRASPAGVAYLEIAARWSALPVDPAIDSIVRRPDPFGFAEAGRAELALSIPERSLLEADGARVLVVRADGPERVVELAAPATAGLVVGTRYWLLSDRLHALDASGEPVLDADELAASHGIPARVRLDAIACRGEEVVVRYRCRNTAPDTTLALAAGASGWARVDASTGRFTAKLPKPRRAEPPRSK